MLNKFQIENATLIYFINRFILGMLFLIIKLVYFKQLNTLHMIMIMIYLMHTHYQIK
jgi:hypothetical protein